MSDNWVVQNLQNALDTWNSKLSEIWQLLTTSPQDFKGGSIWKDRKSTRLNSSHWNKSRMPSSA